MSLRLWSRCAKFLSKLVKRATNKFNRCIAYCMDELGNLCREFWLCRIHKLAFVWSCHSCLLHCYPWRGDGLVSCWLWAMLMWVEACEFISQNMIATAQLMAIQSKIVINKHDLRLLLKWSPQNFGLTSLGEKWDGPTHKQTELEAIKTNATQREKGWPMRCLCIVVYGRYLDVGQFLFSAPVP